MTGDPGTLPDGAGPPGAERGPVEEQLERCARRDDPSVFEPPLLLDALAAEVQRGDASPFLRVPDETEGTIRRGLQAEPTRRAAESALIAVRLARLLARTDLRGATVDDELIALGRLLVAEGVVAPGTGPSVPDALVAGAPHGLRRVLQRLAEQEQGPAGGALAGLACELAGFAAGRPGSSVEVPVALVHLAPGVFSPATPSAFVARLTLERVVDGPCGVLPHPRRMFGFTSPSPVLAASVRDAAAAVGLPATASVRWSLRSIEGRPILAAEGASLGAGFAVGLSELLDREAHRRRRLRRLSSRTLVTGAVTRDGDLGQVRDVDRKAAAAIDAGMRTFVLPSPAPASVLALRTDRFAVEPAETVARARQLARTRLDRSAVVLGVATAVLLVTVAVFVAVIRDQRADEQARQRAAERTALGVELLAEAERSAPTDPRLSLLLALEAHRLNPTVEGQELLTRALGAGSPLQRVYRAAGAAPVRSVALAPSLDAGAPGHVYLLDDDGSLVGRDAGTGELIRSELASGPRAVGWTQMAGHPTLPTLALAGRDGVYLHDDVGGELSKRWGGLSAPVCGDDPASVLAFDHAGTLLAAASGSVVCLWDVTTGERRASWHPADVGSVTALAFDREATTLIAGGRGGVELLDLDRRTSRHVRLPSTAQVTALDSAPAFGEPSTAIVGIGTSAGLWILDDGAEEAAPSSWHEPVEALQLDTAGEHVVVASEHTITRLDRATLAPSTGSAALSYSTPGSAGGTRPRLVIPGSSSELVLASTGGAYAVLLGEPVAPYEWARSSASGHVAVDIQEDGEVALLSSLIGPPQLVPIPRGPSDRTVELAGGRSLEAPDDDGDRVREVVGAFTDDADGHLLVFGRATAPSGGVTPVAALHDGRTRRSIRDLDLPPGTRGIRLAVELSADRVLLIDDVGYATTFDLPGWEAVSHDRFDGMRPTAAAVSPDGRVLALAQIEVDGQGEVREGADPMVTFRRLPDLEPLGPPVPAHQDGPIRAVRFAGDDRLLSVGADGRLLEWARLAGATGEGIWQVTEDRTPEGQPVRDVAVEPDGDRVAVAVEGGVRIHSLDDLAFLGSTLTIDGVAPSLTTWVDGSIAVLDDGGRLHLWRLPTEDLTSEVCRVVGTGLDPAEWAEHLPSEPYEERCGGLPRSETGLAPAPPLPAGPDLFSERGSRQVAAGAGTCADLARFASKACLTYGRDDERYAVTVAAAPSSAEDAPEWDLSLWSEGDGTWEERRHSRLPAADVELEALPVDSAEDSLLVRRSDERVATVDVVRGSEVELTLDGARSNGVELVQEGPVHRDGEPYCCPTSGRIVRWRRDHRLRWEVLTVRPLPRGWGQVGPPVSPILAPDGLAGIPLGRPLAEVTGAVDARLGIAPDGPAAEIRRARTWSDGITRTPGRSWVASPSVTLDEVCWAANLCVYGDAGTFVGWRYGARHAFDLLGLTTGEGFGLTTERILADGSDSADALGWPDGTIESDGELTFIVGVVHAPVPEGPTGLRGEGFDAVPLERFPAWAGAIGTERIELPGGRAVTLSFNDEPVAVLPGETPALENPVAVSLTTRPDPAGEEVVVAAGVLPALPTGGSEVTPSACDRDGAAVVTVATPEAVRSWTLAPGLGLVPAGPGVHCP